MVEPEIFNPDPPTETDEDAEPETFLDQDITTSPENTAPLLSEESRRASVRASLLATTPSQRKEQYEIEYHDHPSEMTNARRVARYLSKYNWYNPQREARERWEKEEREGEGDSDGSEEEEGEEVGGKRRTPIPSLDKAWAYFEHSILPRYLTGGPIRRSSSGGTLSDLGEQDEGLIINERDAMEQAEPGENKMATKLYPIWGTPTDQLADFGIGVGIYFFTMKITAVICLIAGLINIPSIIYFRSDEYTADKQNNVFNDLLLGSAICTDTKWSACPSCTRDDWDKFPQTFERYASTEDGSLSFILVNNCNILEAGAGIASFAALIFVAVAIILLSLWVSRKEVQYDEMAQTTTDYSIEVENPPLDARNPQKWKDFFEGILPSEVENKHVRVVTIALDNEELMAHLTARRALLLKLENMTPPHIPFNKANLDSVVNEIPPPGKFARLFCFCFTSDPQAILSKIRFHEEKIEELSEEKFDVSNVFVTYETEQAQRAALTALDVSGYNVWRNGGMEEEFKFEGKVLDVREPVEPDSVRWHDLDDSMLKKCIQVFITSILSLALIALGGYLISLARDYSALAAAITITVINTITPMICSILTDKFEAHSSEGSKQASMYFKVTLFRWSTTAIITSVITPFTNTTANGRAYLLNGLRAIFITEMVKTPILQLLDIMGNLKRHYLGPRALDQRRMNLRFMGGSYTIGERYTDLTKVLFLTFFYSVVFPTGFFFAFFTLTITYWTDKFCLLRQWAPGPKVGDQISELSRSYFFSAALVGFSVVGAYQWAGFPFDNACDTSEFVSNDYVGTHNAVNGDGDPVNITLTADDINYFYCDQDMIRYGGASFPALPSNQRDGEEWMTPDQETIVRMYGWASVAIVIVASMVFFRRLVVSSLKELFCRTYEPHGKAFDLKFSEVREIFGYIPSVRLPGFPYPLLACDLSGVNDLGLVGWSDPYKGYDEHNLIYDVPKVAAKYEQRRNKEEPLETALESEEEAVFHIVKEWEEEGEVSDSD